MKIIVVDTETTGITETDQVVEVAVVNGKTQFHSLVNAPVPVHPAARAAHHIPDLEIRKAPSMAQLLLGYPDLFTADVLCAHNAPFDIAMLKQSGVSKLPKQTICTWKCSLHLWPDAPGHGNQVLRYHLNVAVPKLTLPPHRALPDAIVTSCLLRLMLTLRPVETLVKLSTQPALLATVRVGQHRGTPWSAMDEGYLRWVLNPTRNFDDDTKYTANHWLKKIEEAKKKARA